MNDRALLLRYMAHVLDGQGMSFIDSESVNVKLSVEEKTALRELETEARIALRR